MFKQVKCNGDVTILIRGIGQCKYDAHFLNLRVRNYSEFYFIACHIIVGNVRGRKLTRIMRKGAFQGEFKGVKFRGEIACMRL